MDAWECEHHPEWATDQNVCRHPNHLSTLTKQHVLDLLRDMEDEVAAWNTPSGWVIQADVELYIRDLREMIDRG